MRKPLMIMGSSALMVLALGLSARAADGAKDLPGPIDSLQDLQDTGKILFKLADDNNDGKISQKEAVDVGNLMVGGYFFRADANGDGVVSKAEMQQARDQILAERPILRVVLSRVGTKRPAAASAPAAAGSNANPLQGILTVIDTNNDGQIQSTELKQIVQTTVQSLFAAADTNRDGQLEPSEVNAAMVGMAKSMAQAAFQTADTDGDGQMSQQEFDKALVEPANTAFRVLDANNDGKISVQEFQAAERFLADQARNLNVPEPANSARNMLRTGRTPSEVAPVPNFNTQPTRPGTPAQPPR